MKFLHVSSLQICHVWTHAASKVGYVGALQQPILLIGLKDQKSNKKIKKQNKRKHNRPLKPKACKLKWAHWQG